MIRLSFSEATATVEMAIFPAVLVEKLPPFLRSNAKKTANAVLGQDRDGIMFWRLHPRLPQFLVVFKRREERDSFHAGQALLEVGGKSSLRLCFFLLKRRCQLSKVLYLVYKY